MEKTNVMRILDQRKVSYTSHCYVDSGVISGTDVAAVLGQDPNRVFKTLVTVGNSKNHYVFMIPVHKELDRKKRRYAESKRVTGTDRIHARRLLSDRNEKTVSNSRGPLCDECGNDYFQRRKDRISGRDLIREAEKDVEI